MINGKKTYILAVLLAIYAISGWLLGKMSGTDALGLLWSSGVIASIRMAITNEVAKLKQ